MKFDHLKPDMVYERTLITFFVFLKIFLGAFLWEGFGLACNCSVYSASFYFMTGLGSAIGSMTAHLIPYCFMKNCDFHAELVHAFVLGLSLFFGTGTAWQRIVNDAADRDWSFNGAFFLMWLLAGLLFFVSFSIFQKSAEQLAIRYPNFPQIKYSKNQLYRNFLLAISVGLGDAFFVATCTQFRLNTMSAAFGVYGNISPFVAMLQAGASTAIGFIIAQVVENILLPETWADPIKEEDRTTRSSLMSHIDRSSESKNVEVNKV